MNPKSKASQVFLKKCLISGVSQIFLNKMDSKSKASQVFLKIFPKSEASQIF